MLLFVGIIVFAQQAGGSSLPTSTQTKQNAQQTLNDAKASSTQFESTLSALRLQNLSNSEADTYKRLKAQIEQLEARILREQARIQAALDQGQKIATSTLDEIQKLIDQHKSAMAEMERFIAAN
jgi:molecular chaperone GrpE (heat shock protein)